jgi:tape measure domain-containing protein
MAVSNVELRVDSRQAVNALRDVNRASAQTESSIGKLQSTIGKLAGSFAAIQAARFVFVKTAEIESQTRSLQVLTGSVQQTKQIIQELQQLGAVTPFTSSELIDSAKRLQAFGVESSKVVEVTRQLADASGATGAELQGLVTAYGQVIAKGRLQGEELLQFQERGVGLQQELQKMYRLSGEELQDALSKGRISAEAVEIAFQRLTSTGGKYANGAIAQSDTLNGRLSTLQDGVEALARRIGQALTPALKAIFNQAIAVVDAINAALAAGRGGGFTRSVAGARQFLNIGATSQAVDNIAKGVAQVGAQKNKTGIQQNLQALQQYQRLLQSVGPSDPNANRAVQLQGVILNKIQQNVAAQKQLNQQTARSSDLFKIPELLGGTGGKGGKKGKSDAEREAERAAKAAAEEQKRVAELVRDRIFEAEVLKTKSELQDKITAAETAGDAMLVARLKGTEREIEIQSRYAVELAKETNARAQQAIIYKGQVELVANQRDVQRELNELQRKANQDNFNALQKHIEQQYQLNIGVQQQLTFAESLAGTLGQTMTSAFDALITGADNWGESLKQIASGALVDIAKQLVKIFIIEQAIQGIKNFLTPFSSATPLGAGGGMIGKFGTLGPNYGIPQRAMGGSVRAGQPYLVGERGPELFMPGRSGGIAPTGSFGGGANIVVNVDAAGTNVQGNDQSGRQLGAVIGAAVQAELIKQKRPGGLLA